MAIGTPNNPHSNETNNSHTATEGVARNYDNTPVDYDEVKKYIGDQEQLDKDREEGKISAKDYEQITAFNANFAGPSAKVGTEHPEHIPISRENPLRSLVNKFLHRPGHEVTPQTETAERGEQKRMSRRKLLGIGVAGVTAAAVAGGATVFGVQQMNQPRTGTPPTNSGEPFPPATSEAPAPSETPSASEIPTNPERPQLPTFDTEITNKTFKETQAFDYELLNTEVSSDPETVDKLFNMALTKAINTPDSEERYEALGALYKGGTVPGNLVELGNTIQTYIENQKPFWDSEEELLDYYTWEFYANTKEVQLMQPDNFVIYTEDWVGFEAPGTSGYAGQEANMYRSEDDTHRFVHEERTDPETGETKTYWVMDPSY